MVIINNLYGYETDKLSKDILLKKKLFYDFYEDDSLKDKLVYRSKPSIRTFDRERISFVKRSHELLKTRWLPCISIPF